MRQINTAIAAAFAILVTWATPSVAASAIVGYTSAAVHQRTGPGTPYAIIQVIPAGAKVQIFGCLTGLTWCDTLYAGKRGWVSGRYLTIPASGQRRPVITFGFSFGVPLIEPWWGYPGYWPPPGPPRPPPGGGGGPPHHEPPHHGPGDNEPPHHGPNGPACGVPGKLPCGPDGAGPGGWHPGGQAPKCGVPGKPPCGPDGLGPGAGGPPRHGDDPQCGVPGKPPCHDDSAPFGGRDDNRSPGWHR